MTRAEMLVAWQEIRAEVERTVQAHNDVGAPLSPWGWMDATELPDALDYIGAVVSGVGSCAGTCPPNTTVRNGTTWVCRVCGDTKPTVEAEG